MSEVYEQVILTCTTINIIIIIGTVTSWIGFKIHDHREKKREDKEKQDKQ